jgi:hypothetical protein
MPAKWFDRIWLFARCETIGCPAFVEVKVVGGAVREIEIVGDHADFFLPSAARRPFRMPSASTADGFMEIWSVRPAASVYG